jgi:hypothetical protein
MNTATYSAEDNKLRLYVGRVPRADYERLKAAGFYSTPKQDCDFAAHWTPAREDLAMEFLDEGEDIGDEDYSVTERAADRAERFEGYREKRTGEAMGHADTFESGPAVFGHQNEARAQRQADKHDRHKHKALSQWSKASYWQHRTAGVISHALHKANPSVRRGRIKTLEAEQRKQMKSLEEYDDKFRKWSEVLRMDGLDQPAAPAPEGTFGINFDASTPAARAAYILANSATSWGEYKHPRLDKKTSLYSLMTLAEDPITAGEAAALWLEDAYHPDDETRPSKRWAAHYENRLTYERAMLENEGGTAAAVEMVPGGWICTGNRTGDILTNVEVGWKQIHAIVRSPVTKQVTSVKVMGMVGYQNPKPGIVTINIERLGENAYRAPTAEELVEFNKVTKERKAKEKAESAPALALINPMEDEAVQLQALLNRIGREKHEAHEKKTSYGLGGKYTDSEVIRVTQKQYSEASKGSYSSFETRTLHDGGGHIERRHTGMYSSEGQAYDKLLGPALCKIRIRTGRGSNWFQAVHIVVITDKPQKRLPLKSSLLEKACPSPEPEALTASAV